MQKKRPDYHSERFFFNIFYSVTAKGKQYKRNP